MKRHAYLTQENIIHALAQKAITELEANKLFNILFACLKNVKH
jgi:hypothetical protein